MEHRKGRQKRQKRIGDFGDKTYVGWNFTKWLVDREGNVVARFEPTEDMKEVRKAVEAAL